MNAYFRSAIICGSFAFALAASFVALQISSTQPTTSNVIAFSQFLHEVDRGRVHDVLIEGARISGTLADGHSFQSYAPDDPSFVKRLYAKRVSIAVRVDCIASEFMAALRCGSYIRFESNAAHYRQHIRIR
jgi:cell division protease FtsH